MSNVRETPGRSGHEPAPATDTDADVVRTIRAQAGPVRTVSAAAVSEALQKLDALAVNGPPAPKDVAAVIADVLK